MPCRSHMFKFLRKTSLYLLVAPWAILGLGCLSNQVVLKANHDKFPVMWNSYKKAQYDLMLHQALAKAQDVKGDDVDSEVVTQIEFDIYAFENAGMLDDTHCVMTDETHFNFLADWIDLKTATYSIGDGLIELGEWLMIFSPFLFVFDVVKKLQKD